MKYLYKFTTESDFDSTNITWDGVEQKISFVETDDSVKFRNKYYDANILFLQPTAVGAYINTGIKPTLTTGVEVKVRCPADATNVAKELIWFGASSTAAYRDGNNYTIEKGSDNTIGIFAYRTNVSGTYVVYSKYGSYANPYILLFNYNGDKKALMYNETKTSTLKNVTLTVTAVPTGHDIFMFCRNAAGNPDTGNNYITRIYYLKLWQGTTLVRDFIPCRIGETGYMFDKVTETLFENNGTQSFTLGEDI